jgi:hypothetical protein
LPLGKLYFTDEEGIKAAACCGAIASNLEVKIQIFAL